MGEVGVADKGADAKTAVGQFLDGVEADTVDVDEPGGALDVEFHQIEQSGAAGDEADVRMSGGVYSLVGVGGAGISEEFHGASSITLQTSSAVANVLDGGDNVGVGATTTDVAAHEFLDVSVGGAARLFEQSHGGHDLAGSTVAALVAVVLDKGGLHGVEIVRVAEALDGGNGVAFVHESESQAGVDAAAIDVNRARPALAMVAALLGAGKRKSFAQAIEKRCAGIDRDLEGLAVDGEGYWDSVLNHLCRCSKCLGGRRRGLGSSYERGGSGGHACGTDLREEGAARNAASGVLIADSVFTIHKNLQLRGYCWLGCNLYSHRLGI